MSKTLGAKALADIPEDEMMMKFEDATEMKIKQARTMSNRRAQKHDFRRRSAPPVVSIRALVANFQAAQAAAGSPESPQSENNALHASMASSPDRNPSRLSAGNPALGPLSIGDEDQPMESDGDSGELMGSPEDMSPVLRIVPNKLLQFRLDDEDEANQKTPDS